WVFDEESSIPGQGPLDCYLSSVRRLSSLADSSNMAAHRPGSRNRPIDADSPRPLRSRCVSLVDKYVVDVRRLSACTAPACSDVELPPRKVMRQLVHIEPA